MSDPQRERLDAALAQASAMDPAQLRAAAGALPEPLAGVLRAAADALESGDSSALAGVLERMTDASGGANPLDGLGALLGPHAELLKRSAGPLADATQELDRGRVDLGVDLTVLQNAVPANDERLRSLLGRALELALDDTAIRGVQSALQQTQDLAPRLEAVLRRAETDPEGAAAEARALQATLARLEASVEASAKAGADLAETQLVIGELRELALERGDAQTAAELAYTQAGIQEGLRGRASAEARGAWDQALVACLDAGVFELAKVAAQRVQAYSLDAGDIARAAVVSHRMADLARDEDPRLAIIYRLEEALFLVRLDGQAPMARRMVDDSLAAAEQLGDVSLLARARLNRGLVYEQTGDLDIARQSYRKVLEHFGPNGNYPAVAGRAAMNLGRLQLAHGSDQATQNLELALGIGRGMRDWMLYAPTVREMVAYAAQTGDRANTVALMKDLRIQALDFGGAAGPAFVDGMMGAVGDTLGDDVVAEILAG